MGSSRGKVLQTEYKGPGAGRSLMGLRMCRKVPEQHVEEGKGDEGQVRAFQARAELLDALLSGMGSHWKILSKEVMGSLHIFQILLCGDCVLGREHGGV